MSVGQASVLTLALMRRARGSTREYAQSDDLEPRARRGGAPARQAGGAGTRDSQPHHISTQLRDRTPLPTPRIGPKLGRNIEHWWYDESPANRSAVIPRSPAITQDIYYVSANSAGGSLRHHRLCTSQLVSCCPSKYIFYYYL